MIGFALNLLDINFAMPMRFKEEKRFKVEKYPIDVGVIVDEDKNIEELCLIPDIVQGTSFPGAYQRKEDGWYRNNGKELIKAEWSQNFTLSGIAAELYSDKNIKGMYKGE